MPAGAVRAVIGQLPGLDIVRVLRPRRAVSAYSLVPDEATEVYVVRIDHDRAELVSQMLPPPLLLEEEEIDTSEMERLTEDAPHQPHLEGVTPSDDWAYDDPEDYSAPV